MKNIQITLKFTLKKIIKKIIPSGLTKKLNDSFLFQRYLHILKFNNYIKIKLKKQLSSKEYAISNPKSTGRVRILLPLIETSHYQYYQLLALAKALEIRGAHVIVILCGQSLSGCELKSIKNENDNDPCWKCRFNANNIVPMFGLETREIKSFLNQTELNEISIKAKALALNESNQIIEQEVNLKQSVDDSVVRYFYGAVPNDPIKVRNVREAHIRTALMSVAIAKKIDSEWSPQLVLSNMTSYSAWEAYYRYFSNNENRFRQVSISQFNFKSIVLNSFQLFPAENRFLRYCETRQTKFLSNKERKELYDFLAIRHSGKAEIFMKDGYFRENSNVTEIEKRLQLDKEKRNIFLFSNLYWDIGLSDRKGLFDGVLDWVLKTIEIVKDASNCHLYIKPHPAEVFGSDGSLKGVSEIVKQKYPDGLKNVTIIEPDWQIKTYNLFNFIDVGVIFTGTVGLELMLSGLPVISTGSTSHNGLGFAAEPISIKSYQGMLLGREILPVVDRNNLELFAYFYFIRTLIPWTLTKQVYADSFDGFSFDSLEALEPGNDYYLDHLCDCIVDMNNNFAEAWLEK